MNIALFKNYGAFLKKLADKGQFAITALTNEIKENLKDHLKVVSSTTHSITVSFYGLLIRFRIEMAWAADEMTAQISAYALTYEKEPSETFIVSYSIDNLGNVNRTYTMEDFSMPLLAKVFTLLHQTGALILRP